MHNTVKHQGRLRTRVAVFVCIATVAILIDQISKAWALSTLSSSESRQVIPHILSLTLLRNPGASLGLGSSVTGLISLLACFASVALVVMTVRTTSMRWTSVFALAFAGAVGNLIDRVVYSTGFMNGKVVDFLDYGWSVGNIADIFLMVAGIVIVVLMLKGEPYSSRVHASDDSETSEALESQENMQR